MCQSRDRQLRRSVESRQRDLISGLLEEWQKSADLAGVKRPRSCSVGGVAGNGLNTAAESALVSSIVLLVEGSTGKDRESAICVMATTPYRTNVAIGRGQSIA